MTLSTHVLDVEAGQPLPDVDIRIERREADGAWSVVAAARTGADGRVPSLVDASSWGSGTWRLVFDMARRHGPAAFWPEIVVTFRVTDSAHHHIPLLVSRHGYTTYRGSA